MPLRPKQYAKALYYEFINQFEKVTIKHAHDRRVAKQLKIKRDLERRGGSSGHHHLVFGQTSPRLMHNLYICNTTCSLCILIINNELDYLFYFTSIICTHLYHIY